MPCRITDYDLVQAPSLDDLQAAVRARLPQGWQPLGGVAVITHPDGTGEPYHEFVQTIVVVVWNTGGDTDDDGGKPARLPARPKSGGGRGPLVI